PLIVRAQVPQIPSRQSESNAIGTSPRSVSSSLTISSISRKEVSGEILLALYSTSLPLDCRSCCRQIRNRKFIVETKVAQRQHLSGECTRPRVSISAPRRNPLLVLEGRSARAPIAAREARAVRTKTVLSSSFVTPLA